MNKIVKIGVLIICCLAFLFSSVDRFSWSVVMPMVTKVFSLNATQAGSYMTAFYIGYIITQLPGGLLADRFGYRKVLLTSFFITGFFTGLMGFLQGYGEGLIFRLLAGLGSGAIFSSSIGAIFQNFSVKSRATASAVFMLSPTLGMMVVNLLIPRVASSLGWRNAFFVGGMLPIAGFILGYFFLKEKTGGKEPNADKTERNKSFWKDIAGLLTNRSIILIGLAGMLGTAAFIGFGMWGNAYLVKDLKLSLVQAGGIMATYALLSLVVNPIIGKFSDWWGGQRKTIICIVLIFLTLMILWFTFNRNIGMFYIIVPVMGVFGVFAPLMATLAGESVEPRLVGTAAGLVNTLWQIGAAVIPIVVGMILDATSEYFYVFILMASCAFIAALFVLFVREERPAEVEKELGGVVKKSAV